MQRYGVPLDSRTHLTKTDWSVWSATLADNPADFEALISPIYDYLNQTTARDPLADSYETDKVHSGGMHARPVIGGVFIKMLADPDLWNKWARARPHQSRQLGAAARTAKTRSRMSFQPRNTKHSRGVTPSTSLPTAGLNPDFDCADWKQGPGGFGTEGTPGAVVRTTWNTGDIWLRRARYHSSGFLLEPRVLRLPR